MALRLQSLVGLFVFVFIAFLIGRARGAKTIPWRVIFCGIALQFIFGVMILFGAGVVVHVPFAILALLKFTAEGSKMVFGDLANAGGINVTSTAGLPIGFAQNVGYFAFFVLPTIILFSALPAVAYHSGIM